MNKRQRKKFEKKILENTIIGEGRAFRHANVMIVRYVNDRGLKDGDVFNPNDMTMVPVEELTRKEFIRRYGS